MTDVIVKRPDGSLDVGLLCEDPSLTKQSEAASCDINKIMAKYERSGILQHVNANEAFYADVSNVPDYQAALEVVRKADDLFMSLPADIRARFDNDPAEYLKFVGDPANKELMGKLGMLNVEAPKDPTLAEQVVEALKTVGAVAPAAAKV